MSIFADGKVENGQLIIFDRARFIARLQQFEGEPIRLTLSTGNKRSNAQNRYMWGVCYPILAQALSEATGEYTDEELVHDFCKRKFLPIAKRSIINIKTGEIEDVEVFGHTSTLSTKEFMNYIERIQQWTAETLGVVIPDPGQEEWV